ncbi:demethylmenaquinone methyltransferase-like [Amphiura filiformis]|uniref:demethylmenaquinone methyltransferase-like n=1 Tax=Amphiura filiformis TaxID=82378 RepID=UPI003B22338D
MESINGISTEKEFAIRKGLYLAGLEGVVCDYYNNNAQDYEEYSTLTGRESGALALAKAVARAHPDKDTTILDVCAGTGLAGEQLKKLGYTKVDALDFSQEMLDLAKSKNIYRNYICDSVQLHRKNQIDNYTYDVLCMNGGMLPGHITPNILPEFTRMTKHGGSIVFNITEITLKTAPEFLEEVVEDTLQSFVDDGSWTSWTKVTATFYGKTGERCNIYTATVS